MERTRHTFPSGPRLRPTGKPDARDPGDISDPARGAKVPRCKVCGMPDSSEMVGTWNGLWGRMPVCERCWREVNPPDPLQVDAA